MRAMRDLSELLTMPATYRPTYVFRRNPTEIMLNGRFFFQYHTVIMWKSLSQKFMTYFEVNAFFFLSYIFYNTQIAYSNE